jgi:hypothetical protein
LTRSHGSNSAAGNSASDVGPGDHRRSKLFWVALPRSPPISATLVHRISIGGGSTPAHAGILAGIIDSPRPPHAAGESQGTTADDQVRASGPGWAFRLLACGLRLIEISRHVGKSSLVRCPGIVVGFRLAWGQQQCHCHRRLGSAEPRVHQHGWPIKPVQKQKWRRADQERPKIDDWCDHKLPERIQAITGRS